MFEKKSKKCSFSSLILVLKYFLLLLVVSVIVYEVTINYNSILNVGHSLRLFFGGRSTNDNHSETNGTIDLSSDGIIQSSFHKPDILRHLVVRTKVGRLRGFVQNVSGIEVQTFLSVPYGQPPVDKLRFRKTKPVKKWSGIKEATEIPAPCIQSEYTQRLFPVHILNENITEDCLYLNIWSPAGSRNKTVMVLIHGGLFTIGSIGIDEYDGRMLAAYGNVIVVTVQYRLGIFGFLDLDSDQIPGNMGLFDQFTALKWIQDNIKYFGGNPDSVTLFGTSAGSISIGFHMFSPMTQTLFKRAILQSGSPMLLKDAFSRGERLAEKFTTLIGCFHKTNTTSIYDNPEPIIDCIDQTPFDQIYQAQDEMVKNNPVPFLPTIPSEYIENIISDFNESTRLLQKEIMMGFNLNEGALMLHLSYPNVYTRTQVPQHTHIQQVQKHVIQMAMDSGLKEGPATAMANLLIRGEKTDTAVHWAQKVADLFSDVMFVCPTYQFIDKLLSLNTTTYLYLFAQRPKNSAWGEWMQVTHHDEINYIMGYPLRYPHLYNQDDIQISKLLIQTWTRFANTGQIPQDLYPQTWQPCNEEHKFYMQIKANQLQIGKKFHDESCDLYNLLSEYIN